MKQGITFETKCWENDYRIILSHKHIKQMLSNCNVEFARKQIIINNVDDLNTVRALAVKLQDDKVIDDIYVASDLSEECLSEFDITDKFRGGYNYSISEVVGIYCCKTKYLLHFSSDSYIPRKYSESTWIKDAINIMELNPDIIVANPTWNHKWDEAKLEAEDIIDKFYVGYGFSDQCYLINVEAFKQKIYNYTHEASERYPSYGGNLFEKRVDSFMRCKEYKRITSLNTSYVSRNLNVKTKLLDILGLSDLYR